MQTQNPYETPKAKPSHPADRDREHECLQKIAKGQKLVIYAILAYFLVGIIGNVLESSVLILLGLLTILVILGVSLWGVILLATNMNYHIVITILVVLLMFVPLVNWLTLAHRQLKSNPYASQRRLHRRIFWRNPPCLSRLVVTIDQQ